MTARLIVPRIATVPTVPAAAGPAPVAEPHREPTVWQCLNVGCPLFYRESVPGRWECDHDPRFADPIQTADRERQQIQARGHNLWPLLAGRGT